MTVNPWVIDLWHLFATIQGKATSLEGMPRGIAPKRSANKKNPEVESCQAGWGATSGVAVSAVARSWNFLRLLIAGAPGACPPCLPMFLEKSSIARRTVNSTMKAAGHE
jgi:hypothetical protein